MLGKVGLTGALAAAILGAAPANALSPTPAPVNIAAADNAFGFALLKAVQKEEPHGNVVLSPVSAALDLAIALNGASGTTATEMQKALMLEGLDLGAVNSANAELIKILRTPTQNVTLSVWDSLWTDSRRVKLHADFVAEAQRSYDAQVEDLDFSKPDAPAYINGWVDKATHGKIPKVIESIDPNQVALLLNAIYFKGEWSKKFDKSATHDGSFTLANGSAVTVPRMAQNATFDYFATADVQAIRLPYDKGDLAMDVFLPSKTSSLSAFEGTLTQANWNAWQGRFSAQEGTIELPRFELKNTYDLNGPLQSLGMVQAFNPNEAEFAKMADRRVSISQVKQLTYLKVDEEGSEAAAVTSIGIVAMAVRQTPPPFHMIVDRPFLCAIEDRRSHALLFIGAIYNPNGT